MAKKQEDNRDIFDKVADIVVPAAGAYVGMRVGRRLGGSKKRMMKARADGDDATRRRDNIIDSRNPKAGDAEDAIYYDNRRSWAYDDANKIQNNRIGGAMIGAASGASGGMFLRDGSRPGKRRK